MNFDIKHLAQKYEIRIQNSSALPQQRSARTQYLLDLAENPAFAGLLPPEQVLDMLDLGQSDKFIDAATVSTRAAEAENDAIMDGKEVKEPETYEDHMKHWPIHVRQLQDWAFKNETDPKIQDALKEHIMTTEHLMVEKAKQNPGYMQMLLALPNFPVVYTPDTQAADAGGMGGVPGGMPSGGMGGGAMDAPMPDGQTLSQGGSGGPQDAAAFQSKPEGSIPPGEPQSQPAPSVQDQINQNH